MQDSRRFVPGRARWLVLGAAVAVGLAVWMLPHAGGALAADGPTRAKAAATTPGVKAAASSPDVKAATSSPDANATAAPPAAKAADGDAPAADGASSDEDADDAASDEDASKGDVSSGRHDLHGIFIQKGGKGIRVEGLGRDREYDSFEQFVRDAPWLAGLVFATVLLVFLIPLLIVVLLIWYKMRKNRLANETLLKLADRGIVPPAAAMDAVASGTTAAVAAAAAPADTPAYEQARWLRRRAVWSDLRKGVILTAVGLGLSFYSMFDDGTPNGAGLIVLFVGLGYCVLWFLEDRSGAARRDTTGVPPAGGV